MFVQGDVAQTAMVIRSLRGSPITVLFAMLAMADLHGEVEIAGRTGFSRKTVRSALCDLEALGFVQRHGRYEAWIITARARQMVLGEGDEGYSLPVGGSSSGSVMTHDHDGDRSESRTTTERGEGSDLPIVPVGAEDAYRVLVRMGCSPTVACESLAAAMAGGWDGVDVFEAAVEWEKYCGSPRGRSVDAPGFLAARRLARRVQAPYVEPETPAEERQRTTREYLSRVREDRSG